MSNVKENIEVLMNAEQMDSNATWTFVRGWEDRYMVSDDGQVWSLLKQKSLRQYDNDGYKYVQLCRDYEMTNIAVHRLVAENFLSDKPLGALVVHHIDKDKSNNHVDNLAIMTAAAHMSYHMEGKPSGRKKGVMIFNAETGEFVKETESMTDAARFIYNDEDAGSSKAGVISRAVKKGYVVKGYRLELI